MQIKSATFIISNVTWKKCPETSLPEFAFIGRSNVGKSSVINMITDRKKLAKTSSTPGKTQLINHFLINEEWFLVDLPGYGYAKTSKKNRKSWQQFIADYLIHRENLYCIFVLIDARHAPQEIDLEFISWLGEKGLSFVLIMTKADKISRDILAKNIEQYKSALAENWEELPTIIPSSAVRKTGQNEILSIIEAAILS